MLAEATMTTEAPKSAAPKAADSAAKAPARIKGRSPNYPSLDLETAIARVKTVHNTALRNQTHATQVFHLLGYKPKSGAGRLVFAALRSFGLLETAGAGASRTARVSEAAVKILLDDRPDSQERLRLLQRAALRPTMHRILWQRYSGALPTDQELIFRLRTDYGFTEAGARDFLRQFRQTLAFAKVDASARIEGDGTDEVEDESDDGDEAMTPSAATLPNQGSAPAQSQAARVATPQSSAPSTGPRIEFPFGAGNVLEVRLRAPVTREEFAKIKALIELAEDSLVRHDEGS